MIRIDMKLAHKMTREDMIWIKENSTKPCAYKDQLGLNMRFLAEEVRNVKVVEVSTDETEVTAVSTGVEKLHYVTKDEVQYIINTCIYGREGGTGGLNKLIERGKSHLIDAELVSMGLKIFDDDRNCILGDGGLIRERNLRYVEIIGAIKEFGIYAEFDWLVAGAEYHWNKYKCWLLEEFGGEALEMDKAYNDGTFFDKEWR